MVFNSIGFASFFIIFFLLFWFVFNRNLKGQNILILIGSYAFYAFWDWRFLSLLIVSSLVNYFLGIYIDKSENERFRRFLIFLGLLQGLGSLLFFKYCNFFIESFDKLFSLCHINLNIHTIQLILPLGISFYTFRSLSYILDIDSGKIQPTKDPVIFFNYVAFFPSLLCGPIDKAKTLIPQLEKERKFSYPMATEGMRQIVWGLFKKMVIADNCANITNHIFDNYQSLSGSTLLVGSILFTIQVYADFSGYSDMAIGISNLLGFRITKNFNFPFFAQNISEFWQKWHISLTAWITEYVFTPLNFVFRNLGKLGLFIAILINFILVGFWHGANWTFVVFGLLNGLFFVPLIINGTLNQKTKIAKDKLLPSFSELINMSITFGMVAFASIIFRSNTIGDAFSYYKIVFSKSLFSIPDISTGGLSIFVVLIFISIMMITDWLQRDKEYGLQIGGIKQPIIRWSIYYSILFIIIYFGAGSENQFIYFKF